MKRVSFQGKRPTASEQSADSWVQNRTSEPPPTPVVMKRLTIDVPLMLHKRIKSQCALQDLVMADVIRGMLEQRFGEGEGDAP